MKTKSLKRISLTIIIALIVTFTPFSTAKADEKKVFPYQDDNGVKSVNIMELAKAMKIEVMDSGASFDMVINGKVLSLYKESPSNKYIYVDGQIVSLNLVEVEDYNTKEMFKFPMPKLITKVDNGYLLPITILEEYLDLKGTDAGYELPEEPTPAVVENTNTNTNTGTNTNTNTGTNTNTNTGTGTGNTNTGTATTTPPVVTPPVVTPPVVTPPVVTPPVVTPPVVNGITPDELANRATGMGWIDNGVDGGVRCYIYKEGNYEMGRFATRSNKVEFILERSSSTFDSTVHQMINLVLPTKGDKLFNIITAPFDNQTLTLDGKSVAIKQMDYGVLVNIYWP